MPRVRKNIVIGARPFVFSVEAKSTVFPIMPRGRRRGGSSVQNAEGRSTRARQMRRTCGANRPNACGQPPHKLWTILQIGCSHLWLNGCESWG